MLIPRVDNRDVFQRANTSKFLVYYIVLHKHKVQYILVLLYSNNSTCRSRVPDKIFCSHSGAVHSKLYWLLIMSSILAPRHVQFLS